VSRQKGVLQENEKKRGILELNAMSGDTRSRGPEKLQEGEYFLYRASTGAGKRKGIYQRTTATKGTGVGMTATRQGSSEDFKKNLRGQTKSGISRGKERRKIPGNEGGKGCSWGKGTAK